MTAKNEIVKQELSMSERFTNKVLSEFGTTAGGVVQATDYQRQLIQGYFIMIDRALKKAEEKRIRNNENNKDHKYDNNLEVHWKNVNLDELAIDLMYYSRIGLDMMADNHLSPVPYKDNKANRYNVNLMEGYGGIEYIAKKYALHPPKDVTTELVYATDTFRPIKKDAGNRIDSYEFEINNPFDRGDVVGGFGYIEYEDPSKNKLVIMTLKDILKRKPPYASPEFWGGKGKRWENGKLVEYEEEGWFEEMCKKTLKREVYSSKHISRDPKKVDDAYQYIRAKEARYAEIEAQSEIAQNANFEVIDTVETVAQLTDGSVDPDTGEIMDTETAAESAPVAEPEPQIEKKLASKGKTTKAAEKPAKTEQMTLGGQPAAGEGPSF